MGSYGILQQEEKVVCTLRLPGPFVPSSLLVPGRLLAGHCEQSLGSGFTIGGAVGRRFCGSTRCLWDPAFPENTSMGFSKVSTVVGGAHSVTSAVPCGVGINPRGQCLLRSTGRMWALTTPESWSSSASCSAARRSSASGAEFEAASTPGCTPAGPLRPRRFRRRLLRRLWLSAASSSASWATPSVSHQRASRE